MPYEPRPLIGPKDTNGVQKWAENEFAQVGKHLREMDAIDLRQVNRAPKKPRIGLIVYADGTDWNPGSGEGVYVYKSGGWTFIA